MQFGQNHSAKASDIDTQTQDGIIVNRNAQRGARHANSNHPFLFPWSKNPSQTDLVEKTNRDVRDVSRVTGDGIPQQEQYVNM